MIVIMKCDWLEVVSMTISVLNYVSMSHNLPVQYNHSDSYLNPLQMRPLNFSSSHSGPSGNCS